MTLRDKKIMPPLWLAYPEIERYSIGWRMGYGEDYLFRFGRWLDALSSEEQACWGPSKKKHFGQANLKRGQVN